MIKLSRRLQALADLVPPGSRVADIGTDHALLPCYLLQQGISPSAVGIEIREGPLQAAYRNVQACKLTDKIDLRKGDGLKPLMPGEVETVILAGMGGNTIREILLDSPHVVRHLKCLIFQPMSGAENVRRWSEDNAWSIVAEDLLLENRHYYQVIKAVPGGGHKLSEAELYYGPLLIARKHPLLLPLVEKDLQALQDIKNQLAKSESEEAAKQSQEFTARILLLEELRECLSAAIQ